MKGIFLRAIKIHNIGPWKDDVIEFSDSINVLIAGNGKGKTAVFNCIKLAVCPEIFSSTDLIDFIRIGESSGEFILLFTDGSAYRVVVAPSGVNYYYCSNLQESNTFILCTGGKPQDLLDKLGSFVKNDLICNLVDMQQTQLFVETSDKDTYDILSFIINDPNLDKLKDNLVNLRIPMTKKLYKEVSAKVDTCSAILSEIKYVDVVSKEFRQKELEEFIEPINRLYTSYEAFDNLLKVEEFSEDFIGLLDSICNLNEVSSNLEGIKEFDEIDSEVLDFTVNLNEIFNKFNSLENLDDSSVKTLRTILNSVSSLNDLVKYTNGIQKEIDTENLIQIIKVSNYLGDVSKCIDNVLSNGDVETEIDLIQEEINSEEGEIYECPIHGRIKFINSDCIPYYN